MVETDGSVDEPMLLHSTLGNTCASGALEDLGRRGSHSVAYANGHIGSILKETKRSEGDQNLLQGHLNPITALSASPSKRVLCTADAGDGAFVCLWDTATGNCIASFDSPHPAGVISLSFDWTGGYLALLSASSDEHGVEYGQEICIVDVVALLDGNDSPESITVAQSEVPGGDAQASVDVHAVSTDVYGQYAHVPGSGINLDAPDVAASDDDNAQPSLTDVELLTNGSHTVFVWRPTGGLDEHIAYEQARISPKEFKQTIAKYTSSCTFANGSLAAVGTEAGDAIMLERMMSELDSPFVRGTHADTDVDDTFQNKREQAEHVKPSRRMATRMVRVHQGFPASVLLGCGHMLATGGGDGFVRFFDTSMKIGMWFDSLRIGPISAISFSVLPEQVPETAPGAPRQAHAVRPFTIATKHGTVTQLSPSTFDSSTQSEDPPIILTGAHGTTQAMSRNPIRPEVATAGSSSVIFVWNTRSNEIIRSVEIDSPATCMSYSVDGGLLAVGKENAPLTLLRTDTFEPVSDVRFTKGKCTRVSFASGSIKLAAADSDSSVVLVQQRESGEWEYIGKHQVHLPEHSVTGVCITYEYILTCGSDGRVVQLDAASCSFESGLPLCKVASLESTGATAMSLVQQHDEPQEFVLADDGLKFRIYDIETLTCSKTVLGPTFGSPITTLHHVPLTGGSQGLGVLLFGTRDKVAGFALHPPDGDPNKSIGLVAQSGAIAGVAFSAHTGSAGEPMMLTTGVNDVSVNFWSINANALQKEAEEAAAASKLSDGRFNALLDGGEDGRELQEAADMYMYSKIAQQGESSRNKRLVGDGLRLTWFPAMVRGIGHFPSKRSEEAMLSEIEREYANAGGKRNGAGEPLLSFEKAMATYMNHRPATDHSKANKGTIEGAIRTLASNDDATVDRETLLHALTSNGESMSPEELQECFELIFGCSSPEHVLPEQVSADMLADAFGFREEALT